MAVLSFSTDIRDRVSYTLYSTAYSSLQTWQQSIVANAGLAAFARVQQVGQYFIDVLTVDPAPPSWEAWLYAEAVVSGSTNQSSDRLAVFREEARRARDHAIGAYEFSSSVANTSAALSLQSIRQHVALNLVRREYFPSVRVIDSAVQWALVYVWNAKNWSFRRRPVTLTIATDSTVTVSDSVSMRAINTHVLYYTDDNGGVIRFAGPDDMASFRATIDDTGKPRWFRTHHDNRALVWEFSPTPDQEYEVRTEAVLVGPPAITTASATTPFDDIPTEFNPIILDLVLGKVMDVAGISGGKMFFEQAESAIHSLGPLYEDIGRPVSHQSVRDVYYDSDHILE